MKKLALLLVLSLFLFCLTGCGIVGDLVQQFIASFTADEITEEVLESIHTPAAQDPELGTPEPEPEPQAPELGTPEPEPPIADPPAQPIQPTTVDVEAEVAQIRNWYQAIVSDPNLEAEHFGDAATVYLQNGQVVSVAEYRQLNDAVDPATVTVHFYYRNGEPFFVFMEYDNAQYDEVRLYFAGGELIRWIIDKNAPYDNVPNAEWQGYYAQAQQALQSAYHALN